MIEWVMGWSTQGYWVYSISVLLVLLWPYLLFDKCLRRGIIKGGDIHGWFGYSGGYSDS
jgi:hypothetical protein